MTGVGDEERDRVVTAAEKLVESVPHHLTARPRFAGLARLEVSPGAFAALSDAIRDYQRVLSEPSDAKGGANEGPDQVG